MGEQTPLMVALRLGLVAVAAFGLALGTRGVLALNARTEGVSSTPGVARPSEPNPSEDAAVDIEYSSFGKMLVSADNGRTLYFFLRNGSTNQCHALCADVWHPAIADAPVAGEGVDQTKLSLGTGDQLAYAGRLLYEFSGDKIPGDTEGQGTGGVWYMISPEGTLVPA